MGSVSSCARVMNSRNAQTSPMVLAHETSRSESGIKNAFTQPSKKLTIVHFNDVYNIEPRETEPVGGAARFKTVIDSLSDKNPLVLFSGDAIAPSNMSVFTEGEHMVPVLNSLGIQAALYGNHEFDFGINNLLRITKQTNFPWLMSNVKDKKTCRQLADGEQYRIIEREGVKIGVFGVVEEEWLATLATLDPEDVIFTDYTQAAAELDSFLRQQGCELVIALTHMRMHNDKRLAENVPSLDLILGGHDHHYEQLNVNGVPILKSGSDFRNFTEILVTVSDSRVATFEFIKHTITKDINEDQEIKKVVEHFSTIVEDNLEEEIGVTKCCLEGRFECIRRRETNLGDLVCDIMREATKADCVVLNSGTFRSDAVHEAGTFKMKDLVAILPMIDALTVLLISGEQLLAALENGVCQYPRLEGRFPQVSGLSFMFNPKKPTGNRVMKGSVKVNGLDLDLKRKYKLCTKAYLADGKDGYHVFKTLPVILHYEEGPILSNIVRNHFTNSCKNRNSVGTNSISTDSGESCLSSSVDEIDEINPKVEGRIIICG